MYKRLLIPLDGSPLAEAVLPYAEALAKRFEAHVYLLQVVPLATQLVGVGLAGGPDMGGAIGPQLNAVTEAMENEARQAGVYLQKVVERLQKGGLQADWEVRRGGAAEQIVRCANEREIDLVAIATHGRGGISRLVFGSVASKVMHDIGRPMLVIAPRKKGGGGDAAEG